MNQITLFETCIFITACKLIKGLESFFFLKDRIEDFREEKNYYYVGNKPAKKEEKN